MNERKAGIFISYINIFLHTLIGFLYVPLLLFYIGSGGYGLYQLIGSFIAYFSICLLYTSDAADDSTEV